MNIKQISEMVENQGYRIFDLNILAVERNVYSGREEPDKKSRMRRSIEVCIFRNNEIVNFIEDYEDDARFGKDAANICEFVSKVGTLVYDKKRGRR